MTRSQLLHLEQSKIWFSDQTETEGHKPKLWTDSWRTIADAELRPDGTIKLALNLHVHFHMFQQNELQPRAGSQEALELPRGFSLLFPGVLSATHTCRCLETDRPRPRGMEMTPDDMTSRRGGHGAGSFHALNVLSMEIRSGSQWSWVPSCWVEGTQDTVIVS